MSQEILVARHSDEAAQPAKPGFRPEVQGLRALAVLMVVTYHVWFGRVSGGVDVFLLISAFLLSLSFIRKIEGGKSLGLVRYWLHLFRRLLPAVTVVILGILAATAVFVPRPRWGEILAESWSSLLYFQNWVLAANAVDYYAADQSVASPLQHFWSLSVQGQVFILWPLLFALAALIARTAKLRFRAVVLLVFGAVFLASLTFSVYETYTNQAHAYFDTRTRLWEFAFGTLLALSLPYLKLPRGIRIAAGWLGLVIMFSVGFALDVQGQFPGYVALWPLAAAALVILAGQTGSRFGADRLLSWKPLIRLGDISYALYLWHWPVLVIYLIWRGREEAGPLSGMAIIILSLILAYLTTRFVERPLRSMQWAEKKRRRAAVVVLLCVSLVAVPVAAWQQGLRAEAQRLVAGADRNYPGAAVLLPGYSDESDEDAGVQPFIGDEWPDLGSDCLENPGALETHCDIPGSGDFRVALIGSSHAKMWATPLLGMAKERQWDVTAVFKGNCPLTLEPTTVSEDCVAFNEELIDQVLNQRPDVVVTTSTRTVEGGEEYLDRTWPEVMSRFTDAGIKVVAIRDTPRMLHFIPDCVYQNADDPTICGQDADVVFNGANPAETVDADRISHLDFQDMVCPEGFCAPVIGNVMVYLDTNHLTASYLRTMEDLFAERFDAALGRLD